MQNADVIFERLKVEWLTISESWLSLVIMPLVVSCVVWAAVSVLARKQVADLKRRVELSESDVADAKAEVGRLESDLRALKEERKARQKLEMVVASLKGQLATTQGQLTVQRRPTGPPSPKPGRETIFDELFGSGAAIDGRLTGGEAERLVQALHEISDLIKSKLAPEAPAGPMQSPSKLAASPGPAWWLYVARKGIPHAIELVAAHRRDLIDFANSLEAAIMRQPDLEFRLRKIVGNVGLIAGLLNTISGYIRSMERLSDGEMYKPAILEMALGGPFKGMVQAQAAVDKWMQLFIEQRAPAVHKEAATYLLDPRKQEWLVPERARDR
jgi:hypothetical protein